MEYVAGTVFFHIPLSILNFRNLEINLRGALFESIPLKHFFIIHYDKKSTLVASLTSPRSAMYFCQILRTSVMDIPKNFGEFQTAGFHVLPKQPAWIRKYR